MHNSRRRRLLVAATPLAAVLLVAGCSSDSTSQPDGSPSPEASAASNPVSPGPTSSQPGAPAASGDAAPAVTSDGVTVTGAKGGQPSVTVTPDQAAPAELVVVDVYEGTGPELEAGGSGIFEYEGVLFSDGTTFDSSWDRGSPIAVTLERVIPGWQEGLVGMKTGGRRLLIIPPDQAYGNQALQGIPPNSTLVFVVDLEEVAG